MGRLEREWEQNAQFCARMGTWEDKWEQNEGICGRKSKLTTKQNKEREQKMGLDCIVKPHFNIYQKSLLEYRHST
jgi:hypothetical protein